METKISNFINRVNHTDLAAVFEAILNKLEYLVQTDDIFEVTGINFIEELDNESEDAYYNRIEGTDLSVLDSFSQLCTSENTERLIGIIQNNNKLDDFIGYMFDFSDIDDFKNIIDIGLLTSEQIELVSNLFNILGGEDERG